MDGDGFQPAAATPAFGSETSAILESLGFGPDEIDRLIADGATTDKFGARRPPRRANGDR
jgi:hypothetical protein